MGLAVHDHRVDSATDIVDRGITHQIEASGLRIDLDLADMRAIGKAKLQNRLVARAVERSAQFLRQAFVIRRGCGNLENSDMPVTPEKVWRAIQSGKK